VAATGVAALSLAPVTAASVANSSTTCSVLALMDMSAPTNYRYPQKYPYLQAAACSG